MGLIFAKFYINSTDNIDVIRVEENSVLYTLKKVPGTTSHSLTFLDDDIIEIEYDESELLHLNIANDTVYIYIKGPNKGEGLQKTKLSWKSDFKNINIKRYNQNPIDNYMYFRD